MELGYEEFQDDVKQIFAPLVERFNLVIHEYDEDDDDRTWIARLSTNSVWLMIGFDHPWPGITLDIGDRIRDRNVTRGVRGFFNIPNTLHSELSNKYFKNPLPDEIRARTIIELNFLKEQLEKEYYPLFQPDFDWEKLYQYIQIWDVEWEKEWKKKKEEEKREKDEG